MISAAQIQSNHEEYVRLIKSLPYPEETIQHFITWLETHTDFFTAPASSRYHNACEGGLCAHTLNVAKVLGTLVAYKEELNGNWLLVALLHDLSKVNYYEETIQNKKVYSENGSKTDNMGRFDWQAVQGYRVKDPSNRFIYASHAQTAEYLARCFFPLNVEESCAILHHMGPYDSAVATGDQLSTIFSRHPLATLLHTADFIATHVLESDIE